MPATPHWLTGRCAAGVARIQNVIQQTAGWQLADTIGQRTGDIAQLLAAVIFTGSGQVGVHVVTWNAFSGSLPVDMTLEEVLQLLYRAPKPFMRPSKTAGLRRPLGFEPNGRR